MHLSRYLSLVDITVAGVVAIAVLLPPRPLSAVPAAPGTDDTRWSLAAAEARALASNHEGAAAAELARQLRKATLIDWAIEVAVQAVPDAGAQRWRAMLAASEGYDTRLDAKEALDWGQRALAACGQSAASCPGWEEVRTQFYVRQLEASIASGIDPRKDPKAFRRAGDQALRPIRVVDPGSPPPPPPSKSP